MVKTNLDRRIHDMPPALLEKIDLPLSKMEGGVRPHRICLNQGTRAGFLSCFLQTSNL